MKKIKTISISEKLKKPLTLKILDTKKQVFNSDSISNIKLLNIYLKALKKLNYDFVSYFKYNGFNLNLFNKNIFEKLNLQKERKINIQQQDKLKKFEFNQEKILKEIKNNKTKIIGAELEDEKNKELKKTKDQINSISLSLNNSSTIKNNPIKIKEKIDFLNNVTNKDKFSILLFIDNLKKKKSEKTLVKIEQEQKQEPKKNKENKLIIQQNIRKYINSKITFNSKIIKYLITSNNYNFNKYNQINNSIKNNIYEFLYKSFISMFSIISKPVYIIKPNKIIIQFYYLIFKKELINKNNTKSILILENNSKLKSICNILTRFFKKPIELELTRLYYPYYNSNILVNLFGIYINKIQLRKIINKFIAKAVKKQSINYFFIKKNNLSSELSGIKIKVAGRLLTQRVIPRKTVKIINRGALSKDKAIFVETARYTNKNKRGAFSITISIGHKLSNS